MTVIALDIAILGGCGVQMAGGGGGGMNVVDTTCPDDITTTELADQTVALANAQRVQIGVAELAIDPVLTMVAEEYARAQAIDDFTGHVGLDGSRVGDRVSDAGYDWIAVAENLAYGPCTAEHAIAGWMDSEGHRTNLLNSAYTDIGVGVYRGGDWGMYWVHVFATRR